VTLLVTLLHEYRLLSLGLNLWSVILQIQVSSVIYQKDSSCRDENCFRAAEAYTRTETKDCSWCSV